MAAFFDTNTQKVTQFIEGFQAGACDHAQYILYYELVCCALHCNTKQVKQPHASYWEKNNSICWSILFSAVTAWFIEEKCKPNKVRISSKVKKHHYADALATQTLYFPLQPLTTSLLRRRKIFLMFFLLKVNILDITINFYDPFRRLFIRANRAFRKTPYKSLKYTASYLFTVVVIFVFSLSVSWLSLQKK